MGGIHRPVIIVATVDAQGRDDLAEAIEHLWIETHVEGWTMVQVSEGQAQEFLEKIRGLPR